MYYSRFSGATPGARYGQIDLEGRIEAASPHGLITILFEELGVSIALVAGCKNPQLQSQALARALNILQSLDGSLDFERGGDVAQTLSRVYAQTRALMLAGVREGAPDKIEQAGTIIAEIAESWKQIG